MGERSGSGHGWSGDWSGWQSGWPARGHGDGCGRPAGRGGPPAWVQGLLGWSTGGPPPPSPGPRVRRGDVRLAILAVLHEAAASGQPINGYQVIQQIAERSDGVWRPSPGSVYPTIQQLEDEGLVEADDERGRRTLRLTAEGREWTAGHPDELAGVWEPFDRASRRDAAGGPGGSADLKSEIGQVMSAVWQIVTQGSDVQRRAAVGVLVETRRHLYGILADGADPERSADGDPS
jgi:DNA-binding PadR family transcriptional regulator